MNTKLIDVKELGEAKPHRIDRDNARALLFRGWQVATGESGSGGNSGFRCDWTRGVNVTVYLTTGGNWIVARRYWSNWQGESARDEVDRVGGSINDLEAALVDGEDGCFRPAEKEAWEGVRSELGLNDDMDMVVD
jgi:hypothetical protein